MPADNDEERLRPVDEAILNALLDGREQGEPWGRDNPSRVADRTDYSGQHVIDRLNVLQAGGHVRKLARGLYEITPDGIAAVEEE